METGTVRSLIPAHSRTTMQWGVSRQTGIGGHFKAWWEAFQEAWIGHRQILQQRPPSYFSVLSLEWLTTTVAAHKGNRIEQFCRFCFATHHLDRFEGCGKWAQSAALYTSSTCLSLPCIFPQKVLIVIIMITTIIYQRQIATVYHSPVYSTKKSSSSDCCCLSLSCIFDQVSSHKIITNIFNLTINLRIINFHPCYHYYHHISAAGRNCLSPSNILHCAAYYARLYITITLQTNNCKHTQHNMKVPT